MRKPVILAGIFAAIGIASATPFVMSDKDSHDNVDVSAIVKPIAGVGEDEGQADSGSADMVAGAPSSGGQSDDTAPPSSAQIASASDDAAGEEAERFEPFLIDGMEYAEGSNVDVTAAQLADAGDGSSLAPSVENDNGGSGSTGGARAFSAGYMAGGGGGGGSTGNPGPPSGSDGGGQWEFWQDKQDPMFRLARPTDETGDDTGTPSDGGATTPLFDDPAGPVTDKPGPGGGPTDDTGPTGAVPEPASWMMLLIGFGAIGSALRLRNARKLAAAPAA